MVNISRRFALTGALAGGLSGCATSFSKTAFTSAETGATGTFAHGVASGDPDQTSVVLWTRLTTDRQSVPVTVEVAEDEAFTSGRRTYQKAATATADHTVKIVATDLEPGRTYYYRFVAGDARSITGRTKTLPERTDRAAFAVVSCSNYPFGYFNSYDHISRQDDLDAVIHLGDYIYEYGYGEYGDDVGQQLGRRHDPSYETISLNDYRRRHAQYKSDPGSQAMLARLPLIAIWDDHETSNDAFKAGAENHDLSEGDWDTRRTAALRAYYEWMPVRDPEPGKAQEALFRSFTWGGFLSLMSIETRLTARTKQLSYEEIVPTLQTAEDIERFRREVVGDPSRRLLSEGQENYLADAFTRSVQNKEPWRLVANQVIMARITTPPLGDYVTEEQIVEIEQQWDEVRAFIAFSELGLPLNMDAWDGYPAARQRFYDLVQKAGARDLVVLTGDTHEAWANDLVDDRGTQMGVELATTSVSSPGSDRFLGEGAYDFSLLMRQKNDDVRFHDPMHRGWLRVELTEDDGQVDYIALDTVTSRQYKAGSTARFALKKENGSVSLGSPQALGFRERVLF